MTRPTQLSSIWLAPFSLQKEIVKAIRQEAAIAREGKPARIIAKMNSLTDESVIRALYDASNDGVRIDLIVRGACSLRPGVPGLSENIRVRSIVGRFLEHSRIFYFRNKLQHDVYLSSADWMNRNLFRRVEIAFPVRSPALKKRVIREGLQVYLKDNVNTWELGSDGHYRRRKPRGSQAPYSAQQQLMETLGMGTADQHDKELNLEMTEHGTDPVAARRG
jgi:polyphosphate kinase